MITRDDQNMENSGVQVRSAGISVIVAAFNAGEKIRVLLESLCASDFRDLEICICDDASTDSTARIIESFAGRLSMRVTTNKKNRGVSCSRNMALGLASAPLLLFLDADVRLSPGTIDRLFDRMRSENADVVAGIYSPLALDPGIFSEYYALFAHHSFLLAGSVPRYNVFNAWCALCRREVMASVGGLQEFPSGVEVENESLGRRMAARGFSIFLAADIEVDHHWGGLRKLLFIFTRRIYWWVKIYFASDRRFEAAMTTWPYAAGTAAFPLSLLAFLIPGATLSTAATCVFAGVFFMVYSPFYAFVRVRRGWLFMFWSVILSSFFSVLAFVSAVYSALGELLRLAVLRRTTLAPGAFN